MAEGGSGVPGDRPEALLKNLARIIGEHKDDVAERLYESLRSYLLDSRRSPSGFSLNERDSARDLDNYLLDRRLAKQYLDTVSPTSGQQFLDLTSSLLNEKSLHAMSPLKFLMALGRKKSTGEPILPSHVKIKPKIKSPKPKGKAPLPPDPYSDVSPPFRSTSVPKLSASTPQLSATDPKQYSSTSQLSVATTNGISSSKLTDTKGQESFLTCSRAADSKVDAGVGGDLTESDIIEGLLFVWQGIYSKIFRRHASTQNYVLVEKWTVYPWIRTQANNLASLGFLHDKLKPYAEARGDGGLVRNCLAGFIHDQLNDYYAYIASIRTEFQKQNAMNPMERAGAGLTLESLRVQSAPVLQTFTDLLSVLESTRFERGGLLASRVYSFLKHGSPGMQTLVKEILAEICQPLYGMVTKWLLEGTLCDNDKEFFIASAASITGDGMWQDKYSVRIEMLPEFISVEMAQKIMSVGRSINFLKERCEDHQPFADSEALRYRFHSRSAEIMYLSEESDELEELLEQAYKETNSCVLEVLLKKYALLDHFQAHRKFLLLGQGEFVHHLMDLLMEVLDKPASQLHPHYLNSIVDSAVRATTAQFEPDDIINRLDAATMHHVEGETGWQVFYLRYHVDGPIGTVFSQSCRSEYQKLFCALWKAKRMEMVLAKAWKNQVTSGKILRKIGELNPILRQFHELTAEMLHFVRQTQYYFLFEVLECAWNHLIEDIQEATNLDAIIEAHTEFLNQVTAGVFMDQAKQKLAMQLRVIYDLVLELVEKVAKLLAAGEKEAVARAAVVQAAGEGAQKIEFLRKRRDFISKILPETCRELTFTGETYRRYIKQFLLTLNTEDDQNLQLLSVRLDFNSYYKKLDSRLEAPLTFQHRRMSSIGPELSPLLTRKFSGERRKKKREA